MIQKAFKDWANDNPLIDPQSKGKAKYGGLIVQAPKNEKGTPADYLARMTGKGGASSTASAPTPTEARAEAIRRGLIAG